MSALHLPSEPPEQPSSSAASGLALLAQSRPPDRVVLARRVGRIGFGAVLVGGGVLWTWNAAVGSPLSSEAIVWGVWPSAFAAMLILHALTRISSRVFDPGRLDDRCLAASLLWPVVGMALALPLSLHAIVIGLTRTVHPGYVLVTGTAFLFVLWLPTRIIVAHERAALAAGV